MFLILSLCDSWLIKAVIVSLMFIFARITDTSLAAFIIEISPNQSLQGARMNHEEPGGARSSQEEPGAARSSQWEDALKSWLEASPNGD